MGGLWFRRKARTQIFRRAGKTPRRDFRPRNEYLFSASSFTNNGNSIRFVGSPLVYKAAPVINSPNSVTARGKPKRRRARPLLEIFGAAPPRDVTLLHVQAVAAIRGARRRAQGVRNCPGGVLIRSSDCHLRWVGQWRRHDAVVMQ